MGGYRHRGSALLVALVITTIAAILASTSMRDGLYLYHQSVQHLRMLQARQLSKGLEDWAISILEKDPDMWDRELPATEIPGGTIQGKLEELSGGINLNSLVDARGQVNTIALERFVRLLEVLELEPAIADQVIDRIDHDSVARAQGAEDSRYLGRTPPQLPANSPFVHRSELLLLPAMTMDMYDRLKTYVYAAPYNDTGINVNTATATVLMALAPGLNSQIAARIIRNRGDGFGSYTELMQLDFMQDIPLSTDGISFHSQYFQAHITMYSDGRPLYFESLLQRRGNQYYVLFRRQGSY